VRKIQDTPIKKITFLFQEEFTAVTNILSQLKRRGYQVISCRLGNVPPTRQDIILLLHVKQLFSHEIDEAQYLAFKRFLLSLQELGAK
jgi:hypothetical protein